MAKSKNMLLLEITSVTFVVKYGTFEKLDTIRAVKMVNRDRITLTKYGGSFC